MHGQVCFGDHAVEKTITFGSNHGHNLLMGIADWLRTKYAVIAGQNFPGTGINQGAMCDIPTYATANKAKENGCKFIVIDPKLNDSAPWCDEWVPISPGSDAAFALAIANILINEKLYDEEFLLKYTNASQLIREDNGQALKDKKGNYMIWNDMKNSADPIPAAGKENGLTLGFGRTFKIIVDAETIKCKTAFQMLVEEVERYTPKNLDFPEKTIEIARELGRNKPSVVFYPSFTSGRYPNWF